MGRLLFTILSAVSLVLFAALTVIGVRSFWIVDDWSRWNCTQLSRNIIDGSVRHLDYIRLVRARVWIGGYSVPVSGYSWSTEPGWHHASYGRPQAFRPHLRPANPPAGAMQSFQLLGFVYHRYRDPKLTTFAERWVIVPLWPAWLLSLGLPLLWLKRRMRNRRRFPDGSCLHCGYNLTGNVSGICPECGEEIDAPAARAICS